MYKNGAAWSDAASTDSYTFIGKMSSVYFQCFSGAAIQFTLINTWFVAVLSHKVSRSPLIKRLKTLPLLRERNWLQLYGQA